jgi:hypothetical protein
LRRCTGNARDKNSKRNRNGFAHSKLLECFRPPQARRAIPDLRVVAPSHADGFAKKLQQELAAKA